jgi:hypothetical protein
VFGLTLTGTTIGDSGIDQFAQVLSVVNTDNHVVILDAAREDNAGDHV